MSSVIQASLTGGELSPSLWGRVDVARYATSLALVRNAIVQPYGGIKNRPGTKFVALAKGKCRLVPFRFNAEQQYLLEFSDKTVRVYYRGAATPEAEIVTPYEEADLWRIRWAQSADVMTLVHPNYPPQNLSRRVVGQQATWELTEFMPDSGPLLDMNTDKTVTFGATALTGETEVWCSSPIFDAAKHEGRLLLLEQRDYGTPWEVDKYIVAGEMRRSDGKYYRAMTTGRTGTLRPTHFTDTWSDGGVQWLYVHSGYGIVRLTEVLTPTTCKATVLQTLPDDLALEDQEAYVTPVAIDTAAYSGTTQGYMQIRTSVAHGIPSDAVGKLGRINLIVPPFHPEDQPSQYSIAVRLLSIVDSKAFVIEWPFTPGENYGATWNSFEASTGSYNTDRWRLGAWGGDQGYPSVVTYFQGRRVFAATPAEPQTIWMSRSNAYVDYSTSSPIQDDDSITATLAAAQVDEVRNLLAMDRLVMLTSGSEWVLGTGQSDVATPTNLGVRVQGYWGSSYLPILGIGDSALFVQSKGTVVRDLDYDASRDKYAGADLTVWAEHLLAGKSITSWAYQAHPFGVVWIVRNDGALLSLTYMREQQVAGWARHDTQGTVEDVCVVSEGDEDAVYLSVVRGTSRCIERMANRMVTDRRRGVFTDSSLTYDGSNLGASVSLSLGGTWDESSTATATSSAPVFEASHVGGQLVRTNGTDVYRLTITEFLTPSTVKVRPNMAIPESHRGSSTEWTLALKRFAGLDHLNGMNVTALVDGNAYHDLPVSGGIVTTPIPGTIVTVGLRVISDLQTLDPTLQLSETPVDKRKQVAKVRVLVQEATTVKAGRDETSLYQERVRSGEHYESLPEVKQGVVEVAIRCTWEPRGQVWLRQDEPYPITWLAIIPDLVLGGA